MTVRVGVEWCPCPDDASHTMNDGNTMRVITLSNSAAERLDAIKDDIKLAEEDCNLKFNAHAEYLAQVHDLPESSWEDELEYTIHASDLWEDFESARKQLEDLQLELLAIYERGQVTSL